MVLHCTHITDIQNKFLAQGRSSRDYWFMSTIFTQIEFLWLYLGKVDAVLTT